MCSMTHQRGRLRSSRSHNNKNTHALFAPGRSLGLYDDTPPPLYWYFEMSRSLLNTNSTRPLVLHCLLHLYCWFPVSDWKGEDLHSSPPFYRSMVVPEGSNQSSTRCWRDGGWHRNQIRGFIGRVQHGDSIAVGDLSCIEAPATNVLLVRWRCVVVLLRVVKFTLHHYCYGFFRYYLKVIK